MKATIAVLPGDGIGPEIMNQAIKVLDAIAHVFQHQFTYQPAPIGAAAIQKTGQPLPNQTLEICQQAQGILLGAVGNPTYDNAPVRPEQGLLQLRQSLGLFANIRPVKAYPELYHLSALKTEKIEHVDIAIYRELSSGIYFGKQTRQEDAATDLCYYHKTEIQRIAHAAFQAARTRSKRVTLVDKANVLETSRLWREVVKDIAKSYPDIALNFMYVDNAVMQLIQQPNQFDVILTNNMFGDILSDAASVITGSLGMLPSASLGKDTALFEPVHGSYPQAAGKDIANPLAMILSTAMLLDYWDLHQEATIIRNAIDELIHEKIGTEDMHPQVLLSCSALGDLIAAIILDEGEKIAINKEKIDEALGVFI